MKSLPFVGIIVVVAVFSISIGVFVSHVKQLKDEIISTFEIRSGLIQNFMDLHRDQVVTMRNLFEERYLGSGADKIKAFKLKKYPENDSWSATPTQSQYSGIFVGDLATPTNEILIREMNAALNIESQVKAAIGYGSEIAWAYYQSANKFLYIAPMRNSQEFRFTRSVYETSYWPQSLPKNNAERRVVGSGPYKDIAGKGWIITIAAPVYARDDFLGVTAIDIKTHNLQKLMTVGRALGSPMLVSENRHVLISQKGQLEASQLSSTISAGNIHWKEGEDGSYWLSSPVLKDEFWFANRVTKKDLYLAAANESVMTWVVLLLAVVLFISAWRLKTALHQVSELMLTDPLTKLYNRRGFYERASALIAFSKRKSQQIAVVIMDIDHFKKINDTHGHGVGDEVLKDLGGHLKSSLRPYDLVCRWGGEEFVVMLLLDDVEQAPMIAEKLRQEVQKTIVSPEQRNITMSGGVVILEPEENVDQAVTRADALLYKAKQSGRNRLEFGRL